MECLSNTSITENLKQSKDSIFKKFQWKQYPSGNYQLTSVIQTKKHNTTSLIQIPKPISVIDNTEKYKIGNTVMTDWGIGIIKLINDNNTAMVNIESNEVEFPLINLSTFFTIFFCVLKNDSCSWLELKINLDCLVNGLKEKLGNVIECHPSQIVLIHGGNKIDKNCNIFELGAYERDVFLAVIKDVQELVVSRFKRNKMTSMPTLYNAIKIKTSEDIIITGLGLYQNCSSDIYYDLLIFEEDSNQNLKLVYSEKKIRVKMALANEKSIEKHKISNIEFKGNVFYQIHQYLNLIDTNQLSASSCLEQVHETKSGVVFNFSSCSIQGRANSSNVDEGLIPEIYFHVKTKY